MFEKNTMIGRLSYRTLALVCALTLVSISHAADEDIDIPYTDTYGYVYDPATGTFIKQDKPATSATDQTPEALPPAAGPMAAVETPATTGMTTPETAPAMQAGSVLMPGLLLVLIAVIALAYRLMTRPKQSAPEQN